MCKCTDLIPNLVKTCYVRSTPVASVISNNIKTKCFAYSLVLYINENPIALSVLPRKFLINDEPLLLECGCVYGKTFIITPNLRVIDDA
uniref:NS6 protein n=1 Tax=Bird deltacoronavirus PluvialisCN24 TaxID=3237955 RepID=A0AB39AFR6_9NIDO